MRIIAGVKRGMKLLSPRTDRATAGRFALTSVSRPITDRVKESLFNVLWNYGFPKDRILADLFCGVGSLGLEALSRGAEFVTFVEKDPRIIATLKKNIEKAGFAGESKVIRADAFKSARGWLTPIGAPADVQWFDFAHHLVRRAHHPEQSRRAERLKGVEGKYDLVFVDPPYSASRETEMGSPLGKLLVLLSEQSLPDGIVVVRTERRTRCDEATARRAELLEQYGRLKVIERRQWGTMAVTILRKKKIVNE